MSILVLIYWKCNSKFTDDFQPIVSTTLMVLNSGGPLARKNYCRILVTVFMDVNSALVGIVESSNLFLL